MKYKYSGMIVCPNHEYNGKMIKCEAPYYDYYVTPDWDFSSNYSDPRNDTITHETLVHKVGLRGSFSIDFWIPIGKTVDWAFDEVFSSYGRRN